MLAVGEKEEHPQVAYEASELPTGKVLDLSRAMFRKWNKVVAKYHECSLVVSLL